MLFQPTVGICKHNQTSNVNVPTLVGTKTDGNLPRGKKLESRQGFLVWRATSRHRQIDSKLEKWLWWESTSALYRWPLSVSRVSIFHYSSIFLLSQQCRLKGGWEKRVIAVKGDFCSEGKSFPLTAVGFQSHTVDPWRCRPISKTAHPLGFPHFLNQNSQRLDLDKQFSRTTRPTSNGICLYLPRIQFQLLFFKSNWAQQSNLIHLDWSFSVRIG